MKNTSWYAAIIISFLLSSAWFLTSTYANIQEMKLNQPLSELPVVLENFKSREINITEDVYNILKTDDLLYRDYTSDTGEKVSVFVSYHGKQTSEAHPHSPRICLPANGWEISDSELKTIAIEEEKSIQMVRSEYKKGSETVIFLYWYQTGERYFAGEYRQKLYMIIDGIFKRRTDVAFVRVSTTVDDRGFDEADKRLEQFIRILTPSLNRILPK